MNPSRFFLALAVLSLTAGTTSIRADDNKREDFNGERHFDALLLGDNEVPPVATRAFATLRATLNHDETELAFTLRWENVTADIVQAHIHFGPRSVNGGVMVFFCGGGGQAACPTGPDATVTGTITAANVVGPTAQGIEAGEFAKVVRALRNNEGYANIHNARFPNGEVRGPVN